MKDDLKQGPAGGKKAKRRVVFRADGGAGIGLGHIVRCLALAEILRDHFELWFAIREPSDLVRDMILESCEMILALPHSNDMHVEALALSEMLKPDDIVVLDGYLFDETYQLAIRESSDRKLVCIDDMHAVPMHADAVINHNGGIAEEAYQREPHTQLYIGPDYALLRPPFLNVDPESRDLANRHNWFVCMGGSDPFNLTEKVIQVIMELPDLHRCHVVIGGANMRLKQIRDLVEASGDKVQLHYNLDAARMCAVMQEAWNAVVPASSVAMEACSVGMRLFTGYFVENQKEFAEFFDQNGMGISLGYLLPLDTEKLRETILATPLEHSMVSRQQEIFGGRQKDKLIAIFEPWM